ncbi:hypothetical protein PV10_01281 [Exophiala mesophila]|uniref:Gag1-like clamp domain-containing protein n=1 Tax=Exophiala mesophila TaxID=212818 RepID=A0A0D1ZSM8_EXOME|nr:uncharacterized protein PV10_01281 [Exophiala mesophila]KIV97542.1 hypothetical protein PV10_01281 [Exophiala mesophila]
MASITIPTTPTRPDSRRPSADPTTNNQSPNSPFFHNLTSRLRKSSNASSLTTADQSPAPQDPVTRTESTRAARKALQALIRNDWEWPPPADTTSTGNRTVRTPIGYRLREETLSDLENEELFTRRKTKNDPYKFESPESIGSQLAEKRLKRKRAQDEELEWNKGLRTWSERRDAWTCAVRQSAQEQHRHQYPSQASSLPQPTRSESSPYKTRLSKSISHERKTSGSTSNSNTDGSGSISAASTGSAGTGQTKGTIISTSSTAQNVESSSIDTMSSSPTTTTSTNTTMASSRDSSSSTIPYIPVFPPLLTDSDNGSNSDALALRSRIKPSAYPTIYSKVVVQSLTPNVPIPLNHMISALVDGWKAEGNWPPQSQAQSLSMDGLDGTKKKSRKSAAFLRWRKEHSAAATIAGPVTGAGPGPGNSPYAIGSVPAPLLYGMNGDMSGPGGGIPGADIAPDDDSKSRVRRSMSKMKRVLSGGSADGLQELGIEFREQDYEEMEKNVTLKR